MPVRLFLIRHGETDWNLKGRYCGHHDVKLNLKGLKQANQLSHKLESEIIHEIYSSDSLRAVKTAKIALKGRSIKRTPQLREMHFGSFEGLTHPEVRNKFGKAYEKWLSNPQRCCIPAGERFGDFKTRVLSIMKKIVSDNENRNVAIFCHGGTIGIFLSDIMKRDNFWKHIPASASISVVEFRKNKPKVKLFNDISHLNG